MKFQPLRTLLALGHPLTKRAAVMWLLLMAAHTLRAGGLLYFVNTTSDTIVVGACENGNPGCSLRGAISAANNHAGADGIEIDLPAGSTINLSQALPAITESVSITGPGPNDLTVRRNTSALYRIFDVNTTGLVTLSGITIVGGLLSSGIDDGQFGAGIRNNGGGTITIINCLIAGNTVNGNALGGGVFNSPNGVVSLVNSTVIGNEANDNTNGAGGGIGNRGILNISNSTIAANHASVFGGGIYSRDGMLNVTNSTITRNGSQFGGGIYSETTDVVKITNSTITSNLGGFEGVANAGQSTMTVKSCIIALNADSNRPDVSGVFISGGFNFISKANGSTGFTDPTDQTGTIAAPLDARLDPNGLQNNGGPTQTIALLPDSPAIDKGTKASLTGNLTTDQRGNGFPRTFDYPSLANATGGDGTDIGAFELLVPFSSSRKLQGATPFDIANPLAGSAAIECRSGGATNDFQIVTTFPRPVTVNGNPQAQLTSGIGMIGTGGLSNGGMVTINGGIVTVPLTNVTNGQTIVITLSDVSDGITQHDVSVPFSFLVGDTTGNGMVNASDISQTKLKSGQSVDSTNFRNDVTASGAINASDVSLVKSKSGIALP